MKKQQVSVTTNNDQAVLGMHSRLDELYFLRGLLRFSHRPVDHDLDRRITELEIQLGYCPVD